MYRYRTKRTGDKDRLDEIHSLFGRMEPMTGDIEAIHKLSACMMCRKETLRRV